MTLFILSALLPGLFWTQGPQWAPVLTRNGITKISVPSDQVSSWKPQADLKVSGVDAAGYQKLPPPGITFRSNRASATREPWVNSDGWHYLRQPDGRFIYDVPGPNAALAAAEAFTFSGQALVQTDEAGLPALGHMLSFLAGLPESKLRPVADIHFQDDGSSIDAECLNLLIRRNLMVEVKQPPASPSLINVVLGSSEYPKKDAANPVIFAQEVRRHLTDEKRSLRIYGSDVVIGRLASDGATSRVFLLNYGTGKYSIEGIRIRVLGHYSKATLMDPENSADKPMDTLFGPDAAELTIKSLKTFAVVDLHD